MWGARIRSSAAIWGRRRRRIAGRLVSRGLESRTGPAARTHKRLWVATNAPLINMRGQAPSNTPNHILAFWSIHHYQTRSSGVITKLDSSVKETLTKAASGVGTRPWRGCSAPRGAREFGARVWAGANGRAVRPVLRTSLGGARSEVLRSDLSMAARCLILMKGAPPHRR